jgi:hypothetical protein
MERAICHGPRQPVVADDHRLIGQLGGDKLPRQLVSGTMPRSRGVSAAFDRRLGRPDASRAGGSVTLGNFASPVVFSAIASPVVSA